MRTSFLVAGAILVLSEAFAGGKTCVKVSDFGFNPEDSTLAVSNALASCAQRIVFEKMPSAWIVSGGIALRSDCEIVFEEGAELVAKRGAFRGRRDCLISCHGVTNVAIRGLGKRGGVARMHRADYAGSDYEFSEWRHTLSIRLAQNVTVENMTFADSGGDGIVVSSRSKDIVVRDCVCDGNYRQGISVIDGENLLFEKCVMRNTGGTPPAAGIDFEPDSPDQSFVNCVMRDCVAENNKGVGYYVYLNRSDETTRPISIRFENCVSIGNSVSSRIDGGSRFDRYPRGSISFADCRFDKPENHGIIVNNLPRQSVDVSYDNCSISDSLAKWKPAEVMISWGDLRQPPTDGVALRNLSVRQSGRRHPWFCFSGSSLVTQAVTAISGNVRLCDTEGVESEISLDGAWIGKTFPAPQTVALPPNVWRNPSSVTDLCPGKMVDLSPLEVNGNPKYLFYGEKGRVVRFRLRYLPAKAGGEFRRPLWPPRVWKVTDSGKRKRGKPVMLEICRSPEPYEVEFIPDSTGVYELVLSIGAGRVLVEKSSAPVGVDLRTDQVFFKVSALEELRLPFIVDGSGPFAVAASKITRKAVSVSLENPRGEKAFSSQIKDWTILAADQAKSIPGIWTLAIDPVEKGNDCMFRLNLFGASNVFFLSRDKFWQ